MLIMGKIQNKTYFVMGAKIVFITKFSSAFETSVVFTCLTVYLWGSAELDALTGKAEDRTDLL